MRVAVANRVAQLLGACVAAVPQVGWHGTDDVSADVGHGLLDPDDNRVRLRRRGQVQGGLRQGEAVIELFTELLMRDALKAQGDSPIDHTRVCR